jgi:CheY-like chemotaxis protein
MNKRKRRERVMIIDDDAIALELASDWLSQAGYDVIPRQSALGSTAMILRERPDLLLLDVHMPALNGPELAKLVASASQDRSPGVIFHSGRKKSELQELVRDRGALGAIEKGADEASFVREFNRFAEDARKRRSG